MVKRNFRQNNKRKYKIFKCKKVILMIISAILGINTINITVIKNEIKINNIRLEEINYERN